MNKNQTLICVYFTISIFDTFSKQQEKQQPEPRRNFNLKMNPDKTLVRSDKLTLDEIPVKIGKQTKFISGVNDFTICSVSYFGS